MSTTSDQQPQDLRSNASETEAQIAVDEVDVAALEPSRTEWVEPSIHQAQETLYRFLLEVVKQWPPEEVLLEFKRLFFYLGDTATSGAAQAVHQLVVSNNQVAFKNTLKRAPCRLREREVS